MIARYPELVIESCSSGGMRMEYPLLSRHSIQSVSDQTNYGRMVCIACNCMTAITPEQAAIWSYPLRAGDEEETISNMMNAMLLRVHLSGHMTGISDARREIVREGISCHMSIVDKLKTGMPFWPIGLSTFGDPFLCVGIRCENEAYLAVWHTVEGGAETEIPMRGYKNAEMFYPVAAPPRVRVEGNDRMVVKLSGISARVLRLW